MLKMSFDANRAAFFFNIQFGAAKLRFQHTIWRGQTQISIWSSLGALAEKSKNGFSQSFKIYSLAPIVSEYKSLLTGNRLQ